MGMAWLVAVWLAVGMQGPSAVALVYPSADAVVRMPAEFVASGGSSLRDVRVDIWRGVNGSAPVAPVMSWDLSWDSVRRRWVADTAASWAAVGPRMPPGAYMLRLSWRIDRWWGLRVSRGQAPDRSIMIDPRTLNVSGDGPESRR